MRKIILLVIVSLLAVGNLSAQRKRNVKRTVARIVRPVATVAQIDSLIAVYDFDTAINLLNTSDLDVPLSKDSLLQIAQTGSDMMSHVKQVKLLNKSVIAKNSLFEVVPRHNNECRLLHWPSEEVYNVTPRVCLAYENGYGDKRIVPFSDEATGTYTSLAISYQTEGKWSTPIPVSGLDGNFADIRNPFMMSDGETLFFSAKSASGVSGYDIYITRFDLEENTFLKPENMGLPFSTLGNDLLFWVDETSGKAYWVSEKSNTSDSLVVAVIQYEEDFKFINNDTPLVERRAAALLEVASVQPVEMNEQPHVSASKVSAAKMQPSIPSLYINGVEIEGREGLKTERARELYDLYVKSFNELSVQEDALARLRPLYRSGNEAVAQEIIKREKTVEQLRTQFQRLRKELQNTEISNLK